MEDRQIVKLYHARDEQAIAESHAKYGGYCQRIALNLLGIPEDARECVNDTWLAAWNRMPPDAPQSLRSYFGRITRNRSISRYRANRAEKRYVEMEALLSELEDCVPSPDTVERELDTKALGEAISDWLDMLPDEDCMLFVRRYFYGDAVKALASLCGGSAAQMAQRMLRLRKSLRSALESEGYTI